MTTILHPNIHEPQILFYRCLKNEPPAQLFNHIQPYHSAINSECFCTSNAFVILQIFGNSTIFDALNFYFCLLYCSVTLC